MGLHPNLETGNSFFTGTGSPAAVSSPRLTCAAPVSVRWTPQGHNPHGEGWGQLTLYSRPLCSSSR